MAYGNDFEWVSDIFYNYRKHFCHTHRRVYTTITGQLLRGIKRGLIRMQSTKHDPLQFCRGQLNASVQYCVDDTLGLRVRWMRRNDHHILPRCRLQRALSRPFSHLARLQSVQIRYPRYWDGISIFSGAPRPLR